jgi:hypothetical protein
MLPTRHAATESGSTQGVPVHRSIAVLLVTAVLSIGAVSVAGAAPAGFKYPSNVKSSFVKGCVKGGGSRSACRCTINAIERRYSLSQFLSIVKRANRTGKFPAGVQRIIRSCARYQQG